MLTSVFLINRLSTPILEDKSPYEVLTSKRPDYSGLRVFGCLSYCSTSSKNINKFQPRTKACVFISYPVGCKGYKLLDLESNSIHVTRNVIFHGTIFPFGKGDSTISLSDCFGSIDDSTESNIKDSMINIHVAVSDSNNAPIVVIIESSNNTHVISAPNIDLDNKRTSKTPAYL